VEENSLPRTPRPGLYSPVIGASRTHGPDLVEITSVTTSVAVDWLVNRPGDATQMCDRVKRPWGRPTRTGSIPLWLPDWLGV